MLTRMIQGLSRRSRRLMIRTITALLVAGAGLVLAGSTARASNSTSTLTVGPSTVGNGANVTFTYSTPAATASSTNWIGIYEPGQVPGQVASTTWQYTSGTSGTATFSTTALDGVGEYQAYYLYDNGYQVLAGPIDFTVVGEPPAPAPQFLQALSPSGPAALDDPFGVAVDPEGDVWVADTGNNRLEELAPDGRVLAVIGEGMLDHPEGIAVSAAGDVWVADTGNNRVVELSPHGALLQVVGTPGSGNGELDSPTAIALSSGGDIYVADQGNNRVEEFSPAGTYLSSISVATPDGVAFDASGDLWVSSPSYAEGNGVYEFAPDGSPITSFGQTQASFGALSNTAGIAIGSGGLVYVVQQDYGFVTVFNPSGTFDTEFGLQSSPAAASEDLESPQGIAIGSDGDIWVADSGNNRVVEYAPPTSSSEVTQ